MVACSVKTPMESGEQVFKKSCVPCHGVDGAGGLRNGLSKPARDLTNVEFQSNTSDEQLKQTIRNGKGLMPAWGRLLSEQEMNDVITYVRTLKK